MAVRVSVSALIVRDGALLLVREDSDEEPRYTFPGGGQEHGETLPEALRREVWEETGGVVEVSDLLWVREYIGAHHQFVDADATVHIVDHLFRCTLTSEKPLQPVSPDPDQRGIEWVLIDQLHERRLYPLSLLPVVATLAHGARTTVPLVTIFLVVQSSYQLRLIPDELRGRVSSVFLLATVGLEPLSIALTGILLQAFWGVTTILMVFVPQVVLAALTTLNPHLRSTR